MTDQCRTTNSERSPESQPFRRRASIAVLALLCAAALSGACARHKTDPAYQPHESLLSVLAEFERFSTTDLYRFHAPTDPSGQNMFRATLVRLANYERLFPNRYPDVLAYARGQAYERLGDYGAAATAFGQVIKMNSALAPEAAESRAVNRRFKDLLTPAQEADSLRDYLRALEAQREGFIALADQYSTSGQRTVYGALAMREAERTEIAHAEALWKHRDLLADGTSHALQAWEDILNRHADSARSAQTRLRAGDAYAALAREYAQENDPEGLEFDWEAFERIARAAMAHYRKVDRAYGRPERLEAPGKIDALNAFVNRVRKRSR